MLRAAVEAVASVLEAPEGLSHDDGQLRERVRLFERLGGLATTGLAAAVRALAQAGAVEADGASSTADWVRANTGRSGRDAARVGRLATDLEELPATRAALSAGDITAEGADAVIGAARDGRLGTPAEVDRELAAVATSSSPERLRADIRDRQQAVDAAAMVRDEVRQHARRTVKLWRKDGGMWGLSGELPDELGQRFRTALDAFDHPDTTPHGQDATPDERRQPGQRLADALAGMTGAVLDRGLAPASGGIVRPHLSIIVHADTVSADLRRPDTCGRARGSDRSEGRRPAPQAAPTVDDRRWADLPAGELPWGGALSPQAVRRICCDASVSRIVMAGDSRPLDVGRATRDWSAAQRRAVNARDRGCRGPSCNRPVAWTAIHHLQWWSKDGPTSVDNGLALCHHCHKLVHDRGWTVDLDLATATATWTSPRGTVVTTTPHRQVGRPPPRARPPSTGRAAPPKSTTCGDRPPDLADPDTAIAETARSETIHSETAVARRSSTSVLEHEERSANANGSHPPTPTQPRLEESRSTTAGGNPRP